MAIRVIFFDLGDTLVTTRPRAWLPGAQALLKSLRQAGFRLGIISNTGNLATRDAILEVLPADFDLAVFEEQLVLFSSEVKKEKPDPLIFEKAVARAAVPANQCLFVTENIVDTLMAQHVGMRTIRVQTDPNSDLAELQQTIMKFQELTR
jgi:HAD superfamily hydrolase (TIGR01509 family)